MKEVGCNGFQETMCEMIAHAQFILQFKTVADKENSVCEHKTQDTDVCHELFAGGNALFSQRPEKAKKHKIIGFLPTEDCEHS